LAPVIYAVAPYCGQHLQQAVRAVAGETNTKEIEVTANDGYHESLEELSVDSELGRTGGGPPTESNNMDHFCPQVNSQQAEDIRRYLASYGIKVGPCDLAV
jgi:hypothetical protein